MQKREVDYQIHRAHQVISAAVENPSTGRKMNEATKKKLFQFFYWLTELQCQSSGSYYSEKYFQNIYLRTGDVRKSWDQIVAYISERSGKDFCKKTATRLAGILGKLGLLAIEHEDLNPTGWNYKKIKARGKARSLKVIRLKTFSDFEEWEAEIAVEQLIQQVNEQIAEPAEIMEETAVLEGVQNSVQGAKSFCPPVDTPSLNINNNLNTESVGTGGQKLISPAEDETWYIEIADGGVARDRKVIPRYEVPDEPDREYYATWIGEKSGQFWTPWVIWDIDADDVQTALTRTRDFVQKLQQTGVSEDGVRIVFSTRRGFHVYLDSRTIGLKPSEKLHSQLKNFAKRLLPDCDDSLYSMRHVIGVPNSLHRATKQYYSALTLEELFTLSPAELSGHANHPHEFERAEHISPVQRLCDLFAESNNITPSKFFPSLPTIKQRIRQGHRAWYGVAKGERDRAMYEYAARCKNLGLTIEETYELTKIANTRNVPRLPDEDIRKKVNSAYRKEGVQIE